MLSMLYRNTPLPRLGRRLSLPAGFLMALVLVVATSGSASTLTLIPIPDWATNNFTGDPNKGGVLHQSEGRGITPDGRFVVGIYYDRSASTQITNQNEMWGFLYNTTNDTSYRPLAGSYAAIVTGIGYRSSPSGVIETVLDGFAAGWKQEFMTTDGGVTWGKKLRSTNDWTSEGQGPILALANTLGAWTNSNVFYSIIQGDTFFEADLQFAYTCQVSGPWPSANSTAILDDYFQVQRGDGLSTPSDLGNRVKTCAVAATGRSVGYYIDGKAGLPGYYGYEGDTLNFVIEWPPPYMGGSGSTWYNYTNVWPFAGLDGTLKGTAWAITPDGNTIFGYSPTNTGSPWLAYKAFAGSAVESVTRNAQLPILPETVGRPGAGITWAAIPFGCSADGRYAVGVMYRGAEKAVLWNTGDPDTNNWTALDLTELAASEGILGGFTRLARAYSVGVNENGNPVVTGFGKYTTASGTTNRAFVMVVAPVVPAPQITSITGVGTGAITVSYTNTVAGKAYTLESCTDLNAAASWYPAGNKVASGTSDFQTESSVSSSQRFYRVSFTP